MSRILDAQTGLTLLDDDSTPQVGSGRRQRPTRLADDRNRQGQGE